MVLSPNNEEPIGECMMKNCENFDEVFYNGKCVKNHEFECGPGMVVKLNPYGLGKNYF